MMTTKQKTTLIFAAPVLLMAATFFGNNFVEGWNWSPFDFIIVNLVANSKKNFVSKLIICSVILLVLMLVWAELAVGIFGSPFAGS
jgi:hypothetical protein